MDGRVELRRGQLLDAVVCSLGCALSVLVALPWLMHPHDVRITTFFIAPCIVLLSYVPFSLPSRAGVVEITFAPAALVYLSLQETASVASALWFLAALTMFFTERHKPSTDRIFNIGCVTISGVPLIGLLSLHRGLLQPGTLLLLAAGCAAYFAVDLVLTAVTLAVTNSVPATSVITLWRTLIPLVCFVGIDTLGYLAALLQRVYPNWTLLLLVVPLGTILVAAGALSRARESERRMAAVSKIAQAAGSVETSAEVVDMLVAELSAMFPNRTVEVRTSPPAAGETGAALGASQDVKRWVVLGRGTGYDIRPHEQTAVETLTRVTAETLHRQRLLDEITRLARYDVLTGLANRAVFRDRLEHALELSARGKRAVAVLYVDLDGFKGVNDRFGHDAGDKVITAVAGRIRDQLRTADTAARLGGDEFAVLAEDVADTEDARQLGCRIVESLRRPFDIEGQPVRLGGSVGLAVTMVPVDAEDLLHQADMAMYRAKAAGKDRVEVFDPEMRDVIERQLIMEDELRAALESESLWLAWQPVVDIPTGLLDGFEVLLRWTHPRLGAISPDVLLPIAAQIGLMPQLGQWVLRDSHRQAVNLSAFAGRPLSLAVNVAAEQLRDPVFIAEAERLAADRRVRLVLELTEHALIDDGRASETLERLHNAGAAVAIDDFGVGYSSISYLNRFRCIDAVKIDRSFVSALPHDERTRALVESVTAMARALDAVVVAEGIEDVSTYGAVRDLRCQLGQGFLFGRPQPYLTAVEIARVGRIELPGITDATPVVTGVPATRVASAVAPESIG